MARIAIIGASGRTGQRLVDEALAAGHEVRALSHRAISRRGVVSVQGDALDPAAVQRVVDGADAVVCALGPEPKRPPDVLPRATAVLIDAMQRAQVKRLVVISGAMIGHENLGWFYRRLRASRGVASTLPDRREQERLVQESGLDWTLVRPPKLTMRAGSGSVVVGPALKVTMSAKIARRDLARTLLRLALDARWSRQGVTALQSYGASTRTLASWIWRMGLAELAGIGVAALAAVLFTASFGQSYAVAFLAVMVAAGAIEGALLGALPGQLLARAFPGFSLVRFTSHTALVAAGAWLLGMLPSTFMQSSAATESAEPSAWLIAAFSSFGGALAGALIGVAQWLALRRVVLRAWRWIAATSIGWALGLPLDMLGATLPDAGDPAWRVVVVAASFGLLAGALVALPTGLLLMRLLGERDRSHFADRELITAEASSRVSERRAASPAVPASVGS